MPYRFIFKIDGVTHFQCKLESLRCLAIKEDGQRCKNHCVMGVQLCWVHLLYKHNLRIKTTNSVPQPNGKGLFALNPIEDGDAILFRRNETIIRYTGQHINETELNRRYGDDTAPYTVEYKKGHFIDAACKRGIGSLANHRPSRLANAKFVLTRSRQTNRIDGVKLVATKSIRNDTEIFVNYGREYKFRDRGTNETVGF